VSPSSGLEERRGCPVWPGYAVAGPGRTAPPQIGRGRRGCGPLVATTLPLGRERPAGPPGSRRGVPSPPRGSVALALPSGLHAPQIPILPFRGGLLPVGESPRPSPPLAPRPPELETQGKPVRAFLAATRQRVRAPQGVRGPPLQPFPIVLARSPPLPRRSFPGSLARSTPRYCTAVLPTANARPSSPPPRLRTTRGEVPPLERGTRCLPAVTLAAARSRPFPLRGSRARGTPARDGRAGPQAGQLGAERGSHPPRYRPSYRAPQVIRCGSPLPFSLVSGASSLPQPPGASRHPQHRPAPHAS